MMFRFAFALAAMLAAFTVPAAAQDYPTRPVTIIVPFAAGGPTDVVARIFGEFIGRSLGQQVIVENVTGAGGTTGSARAGQAQPDGYTLLVHNVTPFVAGPFIYKSVRYDPIAGFDPIASLTEAGHFIVVHKDFPAKTLKELVAYAKENPGKVNYGSAGAGSATHLACVLFSQQAGVEMQHVPYRGTGPAVNDLVAGTLDMMCDQALNCIEHVRAGTLRALAVGQSQRSKALPEIPTAGEEGMSDYVVSAATALYAPKGTPPEVIAKIEAAVKDAAANPELQKRIQGLASELPAPERMTPAGLAAFTKSESDRWKAVVQSAKLQQQ